MAEHSDEEDEFYEVDDLEEMHTAIINNDFDQMHESCEAGADVNEKFTEEIDTQHAGMTPLALASALNRKELVKMLLDYGAEVNATFAQLETTALMTSSFHGHSQIVRILLDHGASAKTVDTQGSTALGYAFGGSKSMDIVKMLLAAGVDVNHKNMLGMNALLLVAGYGNDQLVRLILQSGADPYSSNDFGHTALHLAIVGKRSQVSQLRGDRGSTSLYGLNRRDIDQLLKDWCTSHRDMLGSKRPDDSLLEAVGQFMMAIGAKLDEPDELPLDDQEAMKRRINAVQRYREERLQTARDGKKSGVVDTLLSCGGKRGKKARRSQQGGTKSTAPGAQPPESRLPVSADVDRDVAKLSERCARIMRDILDHECPVDNTESTFGMTPLDMAILMGDVESTAQLLAAGADPDHLLKLFALTDLYDVTVVHPDKKKARDLLDDDDKIDVNQPYATFNITKGTDAPQSVGSPGDAQKPISDDGLTPVAAAAKLSSSDTPEIIKMLVKHGADIKKIGPAGRSPLGEACRTDNVRTVQAIVNCGADVEQQNPWFKNATPVVIAVICKNPKVVDCLIGKGAKLDTPMTDGRTSLIKAMEVNDMPMVDTLLGADKNQNFSDKNGFMYQMVELYQREDRDIEKILKSISDKVRQFQEEDRQQDDKQKPKKDSSSPPPAVVLKSSIPQQQREPEKPKLRPVPPPQLDDSEEGSSEEEDEEEESDDEGPEPPSHPPPPKPDAKKPAKPPALAPKPGQPQLNRPAQPPPQQPSDEEEESEEEETESEEDSPPPPARAKKPVPTQNAKKPEIPPKKPTAVPPAASGQKETGKSSPKRAQAPSTKAVREPSPPPPLPSTGPPGSSEEEDEEETEEEESEEEERPPPRAAVPNAVTKTSTTTHVVKSAGGSSQKVVTETVVTKTTSSRAQTAVIKTATHPPASRAQMEELEDSGSSEEEDDEEDEEEESEEDENDNDRRKPPAISAKPAASSRPAGRRQHTASAETDI